MLDYPMEECIACGNLFRADEDFKTCIGCDEPLCGNCDKQVHEEPCEQKHNESSQQIFSNVERNEK